MNALTIPVSPPSLDDTFGRELCCSRMDHRLRLIVQCCNFSKHYAKRTCSHDVDRERKQKQKHTTGGIPRWSPTLVLVARFSAYVWQSGRDAQFSLTYGRMYQYSKCKTLYL